MDGLMSKAIYKYDFGDDVADLIDLNLPTGAEILSVNNQHGRLVLWAVVDTDVETTSSRIFAVYSTGEILHMYIKNTMKFLGTVLFDDGDTVYHVYEKLYLHD